MPVTDERVFYCIAEDTYKFWAVQVADNTQIVRWGRIGCEGQRLQREFDDPDAAQKASLRLIQKKQKRGYQEVSSEEARQIHAERAGSAAPGPNSHQLHLGF